MLRMKRWVHDHDALDESGDFDFLKLTSKAEGIGRLAFDNKLA